MSAREDLLRLRELLTPLAESFELDDPEKGVVAWVPVVGGTFAHPLTRETISRLKVYGAGADRVKIAEPLFMRSLATIPIIGLEDPSELCGLVARIIGEELGELGRVRDAVAAMGIELDLEHDVLRLRGRLELQGIQVEMTARSTDSLTICALGDCPLAMLDREERTLALTGQAPADLDELARLVRSLDDRLQRQTLEHMEQSLGLSGDSACEPATPTTSMDLGSGWGEVIPAASPPTRAEPLPSAEPQAAEPPPAAPPAQEEPAPVPQPDVPQPEEPTEPEEPPQVLEPEPVPQPEASTETEPERFADGTSDVVELTEMVVEEEPTIEPRAEPEPEKKEEKPAESFDPLRIDYLFEATGGDTEISAHEDRLRLTVPFRVVQGKYTFYLEQAGDKLFTGFLVSPTGARHKVKVDFTAVMDLKEVFERVMLGK